MLDYDVIVVGGGASGFFTAINIAQARPSFRILILERGPDVLNKVRVSGGGRCNVTHAEFIPNELIRNYPRGEKELRGPFHTFMTGDTMAWFETLGVSLKIEADGRVFPVSDSSQSIIDCFLTQANKHRIAIQKRATVQHLSKSSEGFDLQTNAGDFSARFVVLATGSNQKIWNLLAKLGHEIVPPIPSLFTFNIKDARIADLPGLATTVTVTVLGTKLVAEGPLLITHWGVSGPAILKLSAWGARILNELSYKFTIQVNWLGNQSFDVTLAALIARKAAMGKQQVSTHAPFELPKRLWHSLLGAAEIPKKMRWADCLKSQLKEISTQLTQCCFEVNGKSTFKEEFVSAGGVALKEVSFKTFESKKHSNLYLVGELLNVDAITGGFNFQNAWTSGYLAAQDIVKK